MEPCLLEGLLCWRSDLDTHHVSHGAILRDANGSHLPMKKPYMIQKKGLQMAETRLKHPRADRKMPI